MNKFNKEKQLALDQKIIEMVKKGASYSDIQAELSVGASRIILVKKKYGVVYEKPTTPLPPPSPTTTTFFQKEEHEEEVKEQPPVIEVEEEPVVEEQVEQLEEQVEQVEEEPVMEEEKVERTHRNRSRRISTRSRRSSTRSRSSSSSSSSIRSSSSEEQIKYIQKFMLLHEKSVSPYSIKRFLTEIQKEITSERITRASKYSKEILYIQNQLVKLYNSMDGVTEVTLSSKEKSMCMKILSGEK